MIKRIILPALLLLLMTTNCKDLHVGTIIKDNGSIHRTYRIEKEWQSSRPINTETPIANRKTIRREIANSLLPLDTTWERQQSIDTTKHTTTISYTKQFENWQQIQKCYDTATYLFRPTNPKIEVTKSQRLIKTRFSYTEHFRPVFRGVDYKTFFTATEIQLIRNGEMDKSDSLELKFQKWVAYCIINEIAELATNASGTNPLIEIWKTKMFGKIEFAAQQGNPTKDNTLSMSPFENDYNDMNITDTEYLISSIENATNVNLSEKAKQTIQYTLNPKIELYISLLMSNITFSVKMPGEAVSSNADSIVGNIAYWKLDPFILGAPVTMEFTSEKKSPATAIALGAALLSALLGWSVWKKRKKTPPQK
ncbi:MAG: hypothetical protein PF489_07780 [Salinivirgaceae bacterium]|jgi:hypothetical protein|nr:hypothetical protein [Salinivirgaceae bacterium]